MGFAVLTAVLVVIPGPAVTLVMKQTLVRGQAAALRTAMGILVADLFWVAASVVGLTALIVASQPVFQAVRLVGALYLCWLGFLLVRRPPRLSGDGGASAVTVRRSRLSPFVEGALCDLSNPKTLAVFTSVIPQFLPADGGTVVEACVLGVTFAGLGFAALVAYALLLGRIGLAGMNTRLGDALLRVSGVALLAFGVRLAVQPSD